jgi:hypothetical protein
MRSKSIVCVIILLIAGAFMAYAAEPVNLFDNSGFEEGSGRDLQEIPGWNLYAQADATGLLSIDTNEAFEGNQCVHIEVTGVPAGGTWNLRFEHTRNFPAIKDETYTMCYWIKGDPGPITISPSRAEKDPVAGWGNLGSKVVDITPEWQEYCLTFTAGDATDRLVMWQLLISNEGQEYWVDNARCYVGEYVPAALPPSAVSPSEKLAVQWGSLKSR